MYIVAISVRRSIMSLTISNDHQSLIASVKLLNLYLTFVLTSIDYDKTEE